MHTLASCLRGCLSRPKGKTSLKQKTLSGFTVLMALAIITSAVTVFTPTAQAAGERIVMGMPFDGNWAYDVATTAACGTTAHPSCHATSGTDLLGYHWAIDYYAAPGTSVKLVGTANAQATVGYSSTLLAAGTQSCGDGIKATAKVGTVSVGEIYVTHLSSGVSGGLANEASIGSVSNGGSANNFNGCYGVGHSHFSYKNLVVNNSCYKNYSVPNGDTAGMAVSYGSVVGALGSSNAGVQQTCSEADLGTGSSTAYRPAVIQRPSNETDVAVVGPNNNLDFYYNFYQQSSWTKMTVAGGQAYSTPAIVQRPTGETDIAVQGPNNSLHFYYNGQGSSSWGGGAIPNAQAFSAPAMIQRPNGETDIVVRGPNNRLDFYFNQQYSSTWNMITIPGASAYGEPVIVQRPSGETNIAVQGPSDSLYFYYNFYQQPAWGFCQVAISNWALSAPAMIQRPTTGETDIAVQGPSNTLFFYFNLPGSCGWGNMQISGGNSTFNGVNPPAMRQRPSGETDITVKGVGDKADMYFNFYQQSSWGMVGAAAPGYALRPPAMIQRSNGETNLVIIGPSNRLDFYMNQAGSGAWSVLPIAGNNSAL